MESTPRSFNSTIESLTPGPARHTCLVWQLEEQGGRINAEQSDLSHDILKLQHKDRDRLGLSSALSRTLFELSVQLKRLLRGLTAPQPTIETKSGVKLPKMNTPTFDSNILNSSTF